MTSLIFRKMVAVVGLASCLLLTSNSHAVSLGQEPQQDLPLDKIQLPPGFHIELYARVPHARQMTLSPSGTLYVGTRIIPTPPGTPPSPPSSAPSVNGASLAGKELPYNGPVGKLEVDAVLPSSKGGLHDQVVPVIKGLNVPNGVAFKDGNLYIADINRILRLDHVENDLAHPPEPLVINNSFPTNLRHGWKYIAFGPDGLLYVPQGAAFNRGELRDLRFGNITRITQDGVNPEIYARGIRNCVGFDWDPKTHDLWFTDNGADGLGANVPPDELNHAPQKGMNFGFPYCLGKDIIDPDYGGNHKCSEFTAPAVELPAHVAALGMKFYTGTMFPRDYRGDIFIAEHGSWNSPTKVGYRISRVHFRNGKPVSYEPFATGWLQPGEKVWGRPVDVLVAPDGALLVSDDFAGAIYRISYSGASD